MKNKAKHSLNLVWDRAFAELGKIGFFIFSMIAKEGKYALKQILYDMGPETFKQMACLES